MIVLDTNIVLDLLVFSDPATIPLSQRLQSQELRWLSTQPMRDELERVLCYPQIARRLDARGSTAASVLTTFDTMVTLAPPAPKAAVTCKDPDDQKFIDLAVQHKVPLLSKDHAVLCMKKRLLALGVVAQPAIE